MKKSASNKKRKQSVRHNVYTAKTNRNKRLNLLSSLSPIDFIVQLAGEEISSEDMMMLSGGHGSRARVIADAITRKGESFMDNNELPLPDTSEQLPSIESSRDAVNIEIGLINMGDPIVLEHRPASIVDKVKLIHSLSQTDVCPYRLYELSKSLLDVEPEVLLSIINKISVVFRKKNLRKYNRIKSFNTEYDLGKHRYASSCRLVNVPTRSGNWSAFSPAEMDVLLPEFDVRRHRNTKLTNNFLVLLSKPSRTMWNLDLYSLQQIPLLRIKLT